MEAAWRNEKNQIDHMLIREDKAIHIQYVRVYTDTEADSDHFRALDRMKSWKSKNKQKRQKNTQGELKYDIRNLQNVEIVQKYRKSVENTCSFDDQSDRDVNVRWEKLVTKIQKVTRESMSKRRAYKRNHWLDDKYRKKRKIRHICGKKCCKFSTGRIRTNTMSKRKSKANVQGKEQKALGGQLTRDIESYTKKNNWKSPNET